MRVWVSAAIVATAGLWAAGGERPAARDTVRVAAVQCYSRMGEVEHNRKLLERLVGEAAAQGAKIVVLPECAAHGYMDPGRDRTWSKDARGPGELAVQKVAEAVPGPSTRHFAALAKELGIYLVVPLIERAEDRFYNAQVLLDPEGRLIRHHRKTILWAPGDGGWATAATEPVQAADTPFGRLGLMICYEVHELPPKLKEAGVDIVLYSVGWYGPNTETWYRDVFPRRYVVPHGFAVVAANWSADPGAPGWEGHGYSCIIDGKGTVLAMAKSTRGEEIVLADLPLRRPLDPEAARRYRPNTRPVDVDNEFTRANPGYKERAGGFYEKEYLDKAAGQLAAWVGLPAEQRVAARAILRAYIYDWLDAHVRAGGSMPPDRLEQVLSAMDERFQGELSEAQHAKYLEWRKDPTGAHNALRFLMASPRAQ